MAAVSAPSKQDAIGTKKSENLSEKSKASVTVEGNQKTQDTTVTSPEEKEEEEYEFCDCNAWLCCCILGIPGLLIKLAWDVAHGKCDAKEKASSK